MKSIITQYRGCGIISRRLSKVGWSILIFVEPSLAHSVLLLLKDVSSLETFGAEYRYILWFGLTVAKIRCRWGNGSCYVGSSEKIKKYPLPRLNSDISGLPVVAGSLYTDSTNSATRVLERSFGNPVPEQNIQIWFKFRKVSWFLNGVPVSTRTFLWRRTLKVSLHHTVTSL